MENCKDSNQTALAQFGLSLCCSLTPCHIASGHSARARFVARAKMSDSYLSICLKLVCVQATCFLSSINN